MNPVWLVSAYVSIPQSEFCPLGLEQPQRLENAGPIDGFNSSVGILSVGTTIVMGNPTSLAQFQFLSRNSVRWDYSRMRMLDLHPTGFNSSVGILSVGT